MKNMASMMKQAQQMQSNMKKLQDELEKHEVTGTAAGDAVQITMTCKHKVTSIKLDESVVDSDDIETLEDLLSVAFNDASTKAEDHSSAEVSKITGGISLPGM